MRAVVRRTPSRVIFRQQLSNGQYITMRFYRHRSKVFEPPVLYGWKVSLYIGDKKAADRWNRGKGKDHGKQTGSGHIEGLRLAKEYLLYFVATYLGTRAELQIDAADLKRHGAYKWLLRYPGFTDYGDNGEKGCIAYRDPAHWEWNETEETEGAGT